MLTVLTRTKDGVDGYDLGVIGNLQYALNTRGDVVSRRLAPDADWLWECSASRVLRAPMSTFPAELRTAIELAMVSWESR
jgi:hypothetical protein